MGIVYIWTGAIVLTVFTVGFTTAQIVFWYKKHKIRQLYAQEKETNRV